MDKLVNSQSISLSSWSGLLVIATCLIAATFFSKFFVYTKEQNRLGCLDGMRGFLGLGVFLHHCSIWHYYLLTGIWTSPRTSFFVLSGQVPVALFFMITGFLFWYKLWNARGKINWLQLYLSRLFRLVPLYLFAILVVILIVFVVGGFSLKVSYQKLIESVLRWVLFFQGADINTFKSTEHVLGGMQWTLKYEWFFYFSLPVLAGIIRYGRERPAILWFLITAVLCCMAWPFVVAFGINTKFFVYFMVGGVSAVFFAEDKLKTFVQKKTVSILSILAIVLLFLCSGSIYGSWSMSLLLAIFFFPIALGNSFFGLFRIKPVLILGDVSYSIYLLHGILLYLFAPYLLSHRAGMFGVYLGMSIIGVLVIIVSCSTYLFIEKPFMGIGKVLGQRLAQKRS